MQLLQIGIGLSALALVTHVTACGSDDTTGGTDTGVDLDTATDTGALFDVDTALPEVDTAAPPDTAPPDTALPDTAPPDTAVPDTSLPGEFGTACLGNVDCNSGYCVEGPSGYVCTRTCESACIPGWDCKGVAGETDVVFLCLPRLDKLCVPCLDDLQCNGGRCMDIDGELRCARTCDEPADCPSGFACTQGDGGGRCVPETGSCTCFGEFDGGLRSCRSDNGFGTCFGTQDCDPAAGWGLCSARTPAPEACNAQDDDCDAFLDEDIAAVGTACRVEVGGVGSCPGTTICAGAAGLQCQGPTPTPETCDFEDDDCDGQVDEDFKTGDVYSAFDHCGSCNRSCAAGALLLGDEALFGTSRRPSSPSFM